MPDLTLDELDLFLEATARRVVASSPRQKAPEWNEAEIAYLHQNAGKLDDAALGAALGRNANAVKIFRVRQGLRAVSRAREAWLTANIAARDCLGLDQHKVIYWCRAGLIPATKKTHEASGREYFLIARQALTAWVVNPDNWVYFDWHNLPDPHLRRLCELRAARWGDEWWDTRQVALALGGDVGDVKRYIKLGLLRARQPEFPLGGRDFGNGWRNWFVLKSEALRCPRFKRRGEDLARFTPRADAWILRARDELHLPWEVIGRLMGSPRRGKTGPTGTTVHGRYQRLQAKLAQFEDALWSAGFGGGYG